MAMTRRRYVTPEGFSRDEILSLPPEIRLTEIGLRLYADDHGRERVNQRLMLARLYPMDREMTEEDIDEHLLTLDDAEAIVLYEVDGVTYFAVSDWPTVDRPQPSRYPAPPASRTDRDRFVARERVREGGGEREGAEGESGEGGHARIDREGLPPSPFCRNHPDGTDMPCRACGRARNQRKVYDDELMAGVRKVEFEDGDE